jgi:hypothetical protein
VPCLFAGQVLYVTLRLRAIEASHKPRLIALAKQATTRVWGTPAYCLDADLTSDVAFGNLTPQRSLLGQMLRGAVVGYGGVLHRDGRLDVVAKATNWQLLAKELVKGTAELICLHGLNTLDDETYAEVMRRADQLVHEPWMLQSGGELWRRLLAVRPPGRPLAELLMHLARLPARSLHALMLAVLERPDVGRELLAGLGNADEPEAVG